ncbi:Sad1/UNC-like, C-terminal [Penicillium expansum]|uniref:Sad1/UNC-like, C-terminal n=1 Tax=Penicillium expansum TaxID=27334 RepID=A0A0A2IZF4_PENEN|nr:Sad1/UNC-like, C-terminal [Penicillium expansum]KGO45520.1 Sad1/UNC-like, C-terminal [Penicillium expansum]KGO57249.1 Sad1/UNC-like, C-terminal [Penicillium expansum]
MLTAGRSLTSWIYPASILLAVFPNALSNATSQPPSNGVQAAIPTTPVTTCPVKSTWQTESELFHLPPCLETRWGPGRDMYLASISPDLSAATNDPVVSPPVISSGVPEETARTTADQNAEQDQDTDSLLDGASFLSFEDWKKQNLAKVGQSAENVGGSRRAAAAGKEDRRQPAGINNALDSLGDDSEIELDFGGFGAETPEASPTAWGSHIPSRDAGQAGNADRRGNVDVHANSALQRDVSRRKDAGTTCKERFNYASFDCAATVLKTNPECKGSSSVLIENKDSYMLNECRAQNKFLILELCDDILVDTVVLANYEFFSSIFHTFRVSVSDRYPAKPDQWKELGVYEARNTREVQAFAVENSLIWARYLRVEFLTHYGHEFFCPISLIRVHGTTMMEEYKHGESSDRAEVEELEASEANQLLEELESKPVEVLVEKFIPAVEFSVTVDEICPNRPFEVVSPFAKGSDSDICGINDGPRVTTSSMSATTDQTNPPPKPNSTAAVAGSPSATNAGPPTPPKSEDTRKQGEPAKNVVTGPDASSVSSATAQEITTSETIGKATINAREEQNSPPPESTRPTNTQPPSANPTTQESFFKSVHKRLQMLESNSTLSLLYIEEQSRILRDAFNKVEKRQLAKTSTFLENLNVTVLNELREFREQYDHVWRSVALEFEHQRMEYHQEVQSISGQLGVLADELVFQKRVTVIQSIMVLCCFALALFSRGSGGNYMEFPAVQRMVARSYSLRSSSPIFASPSASPGSTRPTSSSYRENRGHRRNLSDSSDQDSAASPTAAYSPPTPTSSSSTDRDVEETDKVEEPASPESMSVPTLATPQPRSQSTPPVLNGRPVDLDMTTPADVDLVTDLDNSRPPDL